jgi:acetyl-CoA synthetase
MRLANALTAYGVEKGDRVLIFLPQCAEAVISHLAAYRVGAIALPVFALFGPDALCYRLLDSGAKVLITNNVGIEKWFAVRDDLPGLAAVLNVESETPGPVVSFGKAIEHGAPHHRMIDSGADDPAIMLYTSGTTGQPKGVLYAHRVLLGSMPGVELPHDLFPQAGDRMWTPADWAWAGGLMDVLLPSLYHGVPVVAFRMPKFDPELAFDLLQRHQIRNVFMPPTALKMMRDVPAPKNRFNYRIRSIASGGERLTDEVLEWGRETFDLTINEFYGQTEANLVVGNCAVLMPTKKGSMGRALPGHEVEVVDDDGIPLPAGETGTIAVRRPDPVMFLRYWNKPEATDEKFRGQWLFTGDQGHRDEEGYFWFHGRDDDVISSAGYRIGPGEIEECLMQHPAVGMAAVIGVPDTVRGEVVKAFVVTRTGIAGSEDLASSIQAFVRTRLSPHECPRHIEFRQSLPLTVTGKIRRRDLRGEGETTGVAREL